MVGSHTQRSKVFFYVRLVFKRISVSKLYENHVRVQKDRINNHTLIVCVTCREKPADVK